MLTVHAQLKDSTRTGETRGVVRDSVRNYALQSATLAIYTISDAALVSYQLANASGGFNFKNLPVDTKLKIVASYVGYQQLSKSFIIPAAQRTTDLKVLYMQSSNVTLRDFVVSAVPPVRINGDTLEFNADAFKLDPNAVAEDLLRKLPGITIWGDGTITVNGKKVNNVLVNGKPFFGGDTKVAIRNLPKNAIDKIQVYQQNTDPENQIDSLTQINIKLKKGKDYGYFGEVAAGYGTNGRYDANGNINHFSNRTQIGIVGTSNNVNKIATDINTLLRSNTFKGANDGGMEYQSDLSLEGTNISHSGGFIFQHDFIPDPGATRNNRLKADYIINNGDNSIDRNITTLTTLGEDSIQTRQTQSNNQINSTNQHFNGRYEKRNVETAYYLSADMDNKKEYDRYLEESNVKGVSEEFQSMNITDQTNTKKSSNLTIDAGISKKDPGYKRIPADFVLTNKLNVNSNKDIEGNTTSFSSFTDPRENAYFNRLYNNRKNSVNNTLQLSWGDFSRWLFNSRGITNGLSLKLQNNLSFNLDDQDNLVKDSGGLLINKYLTVKNNSSIINETPGLNFRKSFKWGLSERYTRNLSFNLILQEQFYYLNNSSTHAFQNLHQRYTKFSPVVGLNYVNTQLERFQETIQLNFNVNADFPSIDQLVHLTDSTNQYYLRIGNINLKPADRKELSLFWKHASLRGRNEINYNLGIKTGTLDNSLTDSSIVDKQGRSIYYTVNADGNKYINIQGTLNKAFDINQHKITVSLLPSLNISHVPSYINGKKNWSDNFNNTTSVDLSYSYLDKVNILLQEKLVYFKSTQSWSTNSSFRNYLNAANLGGSFNFTNKLALSSNITYNYTSSTGTAATHFTVWNINASCRLLKQNNLEFRMSAMDLLHQNMGVINYGSNNTLTHGYVNALKQYFLFTIAYYPRKFGN
jgi:hypothetical protein